jgi:hypothetical protein
MRKDTRGCISWSIKGRKETYRRFRRNRSGDFEIRGAYIIHHKSSGLKSSFIVVVVVVVVVRASLTDPLCSTIYVLIRRSATQTAMEMRMDDEK